MSKRKHVNFNNDPIKYKSIFLLQGREKLLPDDFTKALGRPKIMEIFLVLITLFFSLFAVASSPRTKLQSLPYCVPTSETGDLLNFGGYVSEAMEYIEEEQRCWCRYVQVEF